MRAETAQCVPPRDAAQPRYRPPPKAGPGRYVQIVFVAVVLWAMDAVGQLHAGAQAVGLKHATAIVSIGRDLGDGVAVMMNHWLAAHPLAAVAAASYYIVLHGLVTGIAGIVLLRHRHPAFRLHRNVLIAASAMGTIVFWLYPVAPPRMLPGYHDIAATAVPFFSQVFESKAANQFGSLPSLHVTTAIWVAVATQALVHRPALRAVLWAYPALTVLDVLATANHYMLDVLTAPALLVLAYAAPKLRTLVRSAWSSTGDTASVASTPTKRRAFPERCPALWRRSQGTCLERSRTVPGSDGRAAGPFRSPRNNHGVHRLSPNQVKAAASAATAEPRNVSAATEG
jgi:hypothetical protein